MNKLFFSFLVFIFCFQEVISQDQLNETKKLATTAKIWGFLKYYHPIVANGEYNWDDELFKILPKVKQAVNKEQLSKVYIEWIESLGQVEPCKKCKPKKGVQYFNKNFNLSWLNDAQLFTTELSEKLKHIEDNRHQGKKYYVSTSKKVGKGKVLITNELEFKNLDWKNENLRLLALFRYWNIVEYFFPYKYQTDINWNDVLNEMIPKFSNPKSEQDFYLAMLELTVSIDDSHASLITESTNNYFGRYYIPANFKLLDDKAVITGIFNDSLAKLDDIKIGDIITKVNNQKVRDIFDEKKKYINGSNISRKKYNAYYAIFNGSDNSVEIEFIRNGEKHEKTIKRYLFKDFGYEMKDGGKKEGYKILEGNIGYVNVSLLKEIKVKDIMEALKDTKAIIFDTRKTSVASMFHFGHYITSPRKEFYKVVLPDLDYPGRFFWEEGGDVGYNKELQFKGKVVLLVDEGCQSQCEFTVMCLQTGNNVTTIGSQTSGADGNVSRFNMVGGFETQITGVGIFYPDGTNTQREGVKIDIEVKRTLQGVVEGRDEILEKAIEFANQ